MPRKFWGLAEAVVVAVATFCAFMVLVCAIGGMMAGNGILALLRRLWG